MAQTEDERSGRGAWLVELLERSRELAVIRLTSDGIVSGWLGASERLFGYQAGEIVGRPFDMLFTADDRAKGISRVELETARTTGSSEDDRWHLKKDGSTFWASGVLAREPSEVMGEEAGFAKIIRDRTDVRIGQETLRNRVDALAKEIAQRRTDLLTLLHEMRNSLSPITHVSKVLDGDHSEGIRRNAVGILARQSQVLARLLDDAVSSRSGSHECVKLQPVVLQDALRDAVASLRIRAIDKNQELTLVVPDTPVELDADPDLLQRMLLNLISNALKYTPEGGHIAVSGTVEGASVVMRIHDDGVGIDPQNIATIFDLFTREDFKGPLHPEGSGIGLFVVKRLATLHGGLIDVRSAGRGKGSQFTLQLPIRPTK